MPNEPLTRVEFANAMEKESALADKRTDREIEAFNRLSNKIEDVLNRDKGNVTTNRNGAWPIATITSVLLGLGIVFATMANQQTKIGEMRSLHQADVVSLLDKFQQERNVSLDRLLQKELEKDAQRTMEAFGQAERDSQNRHNEQQRQLDEMRGWFMTPKVKKDGRFNGGTGIE